MAHTNHKFFHIHQVPPHPIKIQKWRKRRRIKKKYELVFSYKLTKLFILPHFSQIQTHWQWHSHWHWHWHCHGWVFTLQCLLCAFLWYLCAQSLTTPTNAIVPFYFPTNKFFSFSINPNMLVALGHTWYFRLQTKYRRFKLCSCFLFLEKYESQKFDFLKPNVQKVRRSRKTALVEFKHHISYERFGTIPAITVKKKYKKRTTGSDLRIWDVITKKKLHEFEQAHVSPIQLFMVSYPGCGSSVPIIKKIQLRTAVQFTKLNTCEFCELFSILHWNSDFSSSFVVFVSGPGVFVSRIAHT